MNQDTPVGVRLLRDLQAVFDGVNALHSVTVLERLRQLHGTPWVHEHGRELTTRSLALHLRPYGVTSVQVNLGGVNRRGERRVLWTVAGAERPDGCARAVGLVR
jgi:hypothetical protein